MTDAAAEAGEAAPPKKKSKLLLIACVLALVTGGGGFFAVQSGLLDPVLAKVGLGSGHGDSADGHGEGGGHDGGHGEEGGAFVFLDPMVISLGTETESRHLKVTLVIDAEPGRETDIDAVRPRVVDVLQGFLRAVDEREFEAPRSMERLRAQMLRRVQLVSPPGSVRDLLVQEFVLN